MFYYKNIGENEVSECNRGGNSLKQNPRISSVPRRTSGSVSFHVWTHHVECSKLGKTQMIRDVRRGMVRNTGFCD